MKIRTVQETIHNVYEQFKEADIYFGHGTNNAWDEANWLVLKSLNMPLAQTDFLGVEIEKPQWRRIQFLMKRRIKEKIPLPYLFNEAYFSDLAFYVDKRVLIPRSPIAELIGKQFQPWIDPDRVHRILDLCTGSGCIAVSCAKAFPKAVVDASDISKDALDVAQINIEKHALENRIHLIQSDLFETLSLQKYDLIVANPPYISVQEMDSVPAEYLHEPKIALEAGVKGLDIVEKIIEQAPQYLKEDGILITEIGDRHLVEKRFPHLPFIWLDLEFGEGDVLLIKNEKS
ncbi:MAG: 50S ribosomal protein L3 N(5)-glutamine methyltransferase [Gammaproteobacteria bacterium]|nr:50S ribosomal protein L3 N(5)-glutamine methyltransferase [Gammaproteobacteria bacterium]